MTAAPSSLDAVAASRYVVAASAAHGAPWLIAYGSTLAVTAAVSFSSSVKVSALVALFQGGIALPVAFLLERRLGAGPLAKDHPMVSLVVQMAMVQVLALPAALLMYTAKPEFVPATFAAIAGGHFLPYIWLHKTRIYLTLGLAVSLGSWLLTGLVQDRPDRAVLVWWSACYIVAAVLLLRLDRARRDGPLGVSAVP